MFGTAAFAELPLGTTSLDVEASVAGNGVAVVTSIASAAGHVESFIHEAPGVAVATAIASARAHVDQDVVRAGVAFVTAVCTSVGRLELGDVVARAQTTPLPLVHVTTEVLGAISHCWATVVEDLATVTTIIPTVTEVSTDVLPDLTVTTTVSET